MAVKENLTGLQVGISGRSYDGSMKRVSFSNEVKGKLHIRVGNESVWIKTDSLLHALNDLIGEKHESSKANTEV